MKVASLFLHPLKSGAAKPVARLVCTPRGPLGDRSWMVVHDDPGQDGPARFVTQRTHPALAAITPLLQDPYPPGRLTFHRPGAPPITVAPPADAPRRTVTVWGDTVDALDAGDTAAAWFSEAVGTPVRLVALAPDHDRPADPRRAPEGTQVSFADGYPILGVSTATLAALADHVGHAVDPRRFRPNVVIEADAPLSPTAVLRAGGVVLTPCKPCVRCSMVDVDPDRAAPGDLALLAALREHFADDRGRPVLGMNYAVTSGTLGMRDPVEVVER